MFYVRRILSKISLIVFVFILLFNSGACSNDIPPINEIKVYKDFSVNFLDVGQGDCIFIRLPDGKNMLIDCGVNDYYDENVKYVNKFLNEYNVKKIDYFILTHPDVDHVGNASDIINKFDIGRAFIPFIHQSQLNNFDCFNKALSLLEQKKISYEISDITKSIIGENYQFIFLSPLEKTNSESSYNQILESQIPTEKQINNLSPIIYFECFNNRFIFTGDAEREQEQLVVNNYKNGVYDLYHKNKPFKVNLENVDFLKVSHHGAEDASCTEFLSLINPKNAIISVGNENFYGHPASEMLERLNLLCPNHILYRTDMLGTITVYKENDELKTISSKN